MLAPARKNDIGRNSPVNTARMQYFGMPCSQKGYPWSDSPLEERMRHRIPPSVPRRLYLGLHRPQLLELSDAIPKEEVGSACETPRFENPLPSGLSLRIRPQSEPFAF